MAPIERQISENYAPTPIWMVALKYDNSSLSKHPKIETNMVF